jgi:restriction endonuclease S subunit
VIESIDVSLIDMPALPKGWGYQTVGELGAMGEQSVLTGPFGTNLGRSDFVDAGVPLLTIGCLTHGGINLGKALFVSESKAAELSRYRLKEGDLLFSRMASVGRAGLVPKGLEGALFNYHIMRLRLNTVKIDARLFINYVRGAAQVRDYLKAVNHGATRDGINTEQLLGLPVAVPPIEQQPDIVAEIEKQFSRLDEAVANLQRVKANLKRYEKATIERLTSPESIDVHISGTISDAAISLDNMRIPVNKLERAKRPGIIPYLGANGRTGWIEVPLFDEELVLVVEDETFIGRTAPFSYYFAGKCWVNNHTHVLRARPDVILPKYLNLALSYYPFIPLTTGSTGRRKLTKAALMAAPIAIPSIGDQVEIVAEVERRISIVREVEIEIGSNVKRAHALRAATLQKLFGDHQLRNAR